MKALLLIFIFIFNCTYTLGKIKWPKKYYFKAEKIDLIQGSVTPYQLWFNNNTQVRIDYYDSTVKRYFEYTLEQRTDRLYMIHAEANKEGNAHMTCWATGVEERPTDDVLPDMVEFVKTGEEIQNGKRVSVWTNFNVNKRRKYEETVYLRGKSPIKRQFRCFDFKNGDIVTDWVINYFNFSRKVDQKDFEVDKENCEDTEEEEPEAVFKHNDPNIPSDVDSAFHRYKTIHQKNYSKDDHDMRKQIFHKNWRIVHEHNSKNSTYKLELNHFADYTPEELHYLASIKPHTPKPGTHAFPHTEAELEETANNIPDAYDWRIQGTVSKVKSQGMCGSCWAFAATAAIEGALSRNNGGRNMDLSEQSIVDCAWAYDVYGCDGGYTERAFNYVLEHGIPTEEEYGGYLEQDGICHVNNMTNPYKIGGYVAVTPNSPNALKAAVYRYGPVAVYVNVSMRMYLYSTGIYYELGNPRKPYLVNHVVLVVGYGVRDGDLFWIVKNSWGPGWGEEGYILISARDNTGNVLYAPYYPLV